MASKTPIEYRRPGAPQPSPPKWWRQRWPILVTGAAVLLIAIILFAGTSAGIVISRLVTDGSMLALWLLAAHGYGSVLLPLPLRERAGVRGGRAEACNELTPVESDALTPHPNPLPQGERGPELRGVTRLALGLGTISLLQLLLGLAGGIHRVAAFAIIAIGIALLLWRHRQTTRAEIITWFTTPADYEWLWLLAMPLLAMAIVAAYVPPGVLWGDEPHGYDVLSYHLQLPREWYELGRIAPLKHNVFSYFPLAVEMHYLLAMQLLGGPWAGMYLAQLMHVAMIALTVVAVYATARQFAPKLLAMMAALSAASVPWMFLLAPVAYNEGGLLLFGTLAIAWAIRAAVGDAATRDWIIAGVFAGFACGTKLTGVPLVLFIMPLAVAMALRRPRVLRGCAIYILTGLLVFSPWLIRNTIWTGNPVFPEAQNILGRGHFSEQQTERWRRAHSPTAAQRSLKARVIAARDQIAGDWRYGYLFLLPAIAGMLFTIRRPRTHLLVLLFLFFLLFWIGFTHLQGRFFVLAIPVAALGVALTAQRRQEWQLVIVAATAALQITVGMYLSFERFRDIVTPLAENSLLGYDDVKSMLPANTSNAIAGGKPIALIGDARAFLYPAPTSRLHYRTVFDVDVKTGQSLTSAWDEGAPPSALRVLDLPELQRFANTYYGIPKPD